MLVFITSCPTTTSPSPKPNPEPDPTPPVEEHTHTFEKTWSYDNTYHFHKATCGHDVVSGKEQHKLNEYTFKCDICGFEHKHTYSSIWSYNETYHYHNDTCGHNTINDKNEHTFDENYVCTTCGFTHTHTFDEKTWSYDNTYHFHKATCGHDEKKDTAYHSYSNFICTVCGYKYKDPSEENPSKDGFDIEYIGNAYRIISGGTFNGTELVIPLTFNDGKNGEYPITEIANDAFSRYEIRTLNTSNVEKIGQNAFSYTSLEEVVLGDALKEIGNFAFSYCKSLKTLTIGKNLTTLGSGALGSLNAIENIIYNAVDLDIKEQEIIESKPNLKTITIGKDVENIHSYMFQNSPSLETVYYNSKNIKNAILLFRGSNLKNIYIGEDVVALSPYLFSNCSYLSNVVMNNNLKKIGQSCFDGCTSLTTITFPTSLNEIYAFAFRGNGFTSLSIPSGITYIENRAFQDCKNLKNVYWDAKNYIHEDADGNNDKDSEWDGGIFTGCSSIKTATFGENANSVPYGLFADIYTLETVDLGESIKEIGYGAFWSCTSLKQIIIPKSVTTIYPMAFNRCENLSSVTFNEGLLYLGDYAFNGCEILSEVILPDSLLSISNAFSECSFLETVHFGKSVELINGDDMFSQDSALLSITVDPLNTHYIAENNVLYDIAKTMVIKYASRNTAAHYDMPDTITTIGQEAFADTYYLQTIKVSQSLKEIKMWAFYGSNIKSINLPDSLTTIGTSAFAECLLLESLEIGKNLETIDAYTFYITPSLSSIKISSENKNYKTIDGVIFNKNGDYLIKYPAGSSAKSYTIADTIKMVSKNAFVGVMALEKLYSPKNATWYLSLYEDMSNKRCMDDFTDKELEDARMKRIDFVNDPDGFAECLSREDNWSSFYLENTSYTAK